MFRKIQIWFSFQYTSVLFSLWKRTENQFFRYEILYLYSKNQLSNSHSFPVISIWIFRKNDIFVFQFTGVLFKLSRRAKKQVVRRVTLYLPAENQLSTSYSLSVISFWIFLNPNLIFEFTCVLFTLSKRTQHKLFAELLSTCPLKTNFLRTIVCL